MPLTVRVLSNLSNFAVIYEILWTSDTANRHHRRNAYHKILHISRITFFFKLEALHLAFRARFEQCSSGHNGMVCSALYVHTKWMLARHSILIRLLECVWVCDVLCKPTNIGEREKKKKQWEKYVLHTNAKIKILQTHFIHGDYYYDCRLLWRQTQMVCIRFAHIWEMSWHCDRLVAIHSWGHLTQYGCSSRHSTRKIIQIEIQCRC